MFINSVTYNGDTIDCPHITHTFLLNSFLFQERANINLKKYYRNMFVKRTGAKRRPHRQLDSYLPICDAQVDKCVSRTTIYMSACL